MPLLVILVLQVRTDIASAADEIIVNPSSLVGSIGVIMPNYGVSGLMQKFGVEDRTMTSGETKRFYP